MRKIIHLIVLVTFLLPYSSKAETKLKSPNNRTESVVSINMSGISMSVIFDGETIIKNIDLKLMEGDHNLFQNVEVTDEHQSSFSEYWHTINGKNKNVLNQYKLYTFELKSTKNKKINLEVRLYNEGFAYRFILPEGAKKVEENSIIQFADNYTFWAYNGEHHNVGPAKLSEYNKKTVRNPVTFKTKTDKFFAIHEAAIFDHAPFVLTNSKNYLFELKQEIASDSATKTSWRAFVLGEKPGDLIESDLLVNLNEPCKIEDPSWIKPGRAMWDWRVWGYTAADGFKYGLNTTSHKRFIDFASRNNIQYLLIDADWYGPEFDKSSDPTSAREGVDIIECIAYGKEKGVGVILYLNDVGANKFGLERILKQFSEWGASGVKYGFMQGSSKEKVRNTRRIVELCAKYKLTVNFHDNPIAPSGDRRTWPNLITKEFGHSQSDAKRSYFPETMVTAPFVNMLAGPLDLCNGWFALETAFTSNRHKVFEEIPGTVAAEVAKLIVVYGGCFILPDAPEEYLKKDDLFDCIRNMPAHFDSYKVLDGEIGKYISVARSSGNDWFVGSLTNRASREITVKFNFLDPDKKYVATFYEDTANTHFLENKEVYQVREYIPVQKGSEVKVKLASGGGHSIWIRSVE